MSDRFQHILIALAVMVALWSSCCPRSTWVPELLPVIGLWTASLWTSWPSGMRPVGSPVGCCWRLGRASRDCWSGWLGARSDESGWP